MSWRGYERSGADVPEPATADAVEWGVVSRSRRGERMSGDLAVVTPRREGTLVAGIDGLGHGSEAALAARLAGDVVLQSATGDLIRLVHRCHDALAGTRGAAISLAFVSWATSELTWLGVGNVEGRLLSGDPSATRPRASLALERGVPGHELPTLHTATVGVRPGDVLVFATDGIEADFADRPDISGSPQAISERILGAYWKRADDALVVTLRYLGVRA
jgi:hypothetical protein